MITFDVLTLKAFVTEQKEFINGSRINKIQQPTRREFLIYLRNMGQTRPLYINIHPQYYHACFTCEKNIKKRYLEIPQKPPMFCMQLRKYLENSKISEVKQVENERILEFYIETYNEIGEKIFLCLAIEFMGKHSNVILYNTDTNIIIGCAHNVGFEKSRERELYGGIPYIYPPKQFKSNILNYMGEVNYNNLQDEFYMFSSNFAKLCYGKTIDKLKSYVNLENLSPAIYDNFQKYCLFTELIKDMDVTGYNIVNNMLDDYYTYHIYDHKYNEFKNEFINITNQNLKKLTKTIDLREEKLTKDNRGDEFRLWGDLLMANLYNLQDYKKNANVFDYENNKYIDISLDETLTIKDNANKFYKLYNKSKNSRIKLKELLKQDKTQKEYYEQIKYSIDNAQTIEELLEIAPEILEKDNFKHPKKTNKKELNILSINLENETKIYIGKNNTQNDYIVSKLASDEDIWFHVHNNAGSHVLLKTQKITDELILYCAKLAKEYSTVKNSPKIGVIYTKRKYLKKPPAANPGYVTYRNEKEIIID